MGNWSDSDSDRLRLAMPYDVSDYTAVHPDGDGTRKSTGDPSWAARDNP